jgi:hypothetical protein
MRENIINIDSELLYPNEEKNYTKGETALWRSVIIRALEDLSLPSSNKRYKLWKKQAYQWFFSQNEEFIIICEMANLSPQYVLKIAYEIVNKNF